MTDTDVVETPAPLASPSVPVVDVTELPETPVQDYTYVRLPSGEVRAIPAEQIQNVAITTATSDAPAPVADAAKEDEHFYVHLSNGEVERVKESDLPTSAGTNAPFGYWQKGNKVFLIVAVYPVEIEVN